MSKETIIFGNEMSEKTMNKAKKSKAKLLKQFGDDSQKKYHLKIVENNVLKDIGTYNLEINEESLQINVENPIIIGNIRMGFGHYRISMAMCSAAKALGYTPLWFDLNAFKDTTGGKIINHMNNLYSMGSRWSQKYPLFNKLYWEPLNSEGFRKLTYNAIDQKNAELMTPIFNDLPKKIPFLATHVWPAQAAVHYGMEQVVNAIPDNWQMGLHLAEGSIHTVQTPSAYLGYKTLRGMDGDKILHPMPEGSIVNTGHYIDHELVFHLEADSKKRIERATKKQPLRYLLTVGGAGAQQELFKRIILNLIPKVKANQAVLFINVGDHKKVWENLLIQIPELEKLTQLHFDNYEEIKTFAQQAIDGDVKGIHAFYNEDIFAAVYSTNLLMRSSDLLITKPSELAFYPIPKLMIKRVGGHEAWGAIRSAEVGDGTFECETIDQTLQMLNLLDSERHLMVELSNNILKANQIGTYNGAYEVIRLATKKK